VSSSSCVGRNGDDDNDKSRLGDVVAVVRSTPVVSSDVRSIVVDAMVAVVVETVPGKPKLR
jgi:hypothetical protein